MSDSSPDAELNGFTKIALGIVLAIVLVGAVASVWLLGVSALPAAIVSVYVVTVIAYGVTRGSVRTKRFRVALYLGVFAWGGVEYLGGARDLLTYLLLAIGALMLTRELTFRD